MNADLGGFCCSKMTRNDAKQAIKSNWAVQELLAGLGASVVSTLDPGVRTRVVNCPGGGFVLIAPTMPSLPRGP